MLVVESVMLSDEIGLESALKKPYRTKLREWLESEWVGEWESVVPKLDNPSNVAEYPLERESPINSIDLL